MRCLTGSAARAHSSAATEASFDLWHLLYSFQDCLFPLTNLPMPQDMSCDCTHFPPYPHSVPPFAIRTPRAPFAIDAAFDTNDLAHALT